MPLAISSAAFAQNGEIPQKCTCDGRNLSPELKWVESPPKTASFALICDDPDAPSGTWTHWVIFNLPAGSTGLPEGVPAEAQLPDGARQGTNDFARIGYGGPCPPPGPAHRYYFRLYALDARLEVKAGASRKDVDRAMQRHVLGQAEWMGRYARRK